MQRALPPCKYGDKCYRKNPAHLAQFSHPAASKKRDNDGEGGDSPGAKRPRRDDSNASTTSLSDVSSQDMNTLKGDSQMSEDPGTAALSSTSAPPLATGDAEPTAATAGGGAAATAVSSQDPESEANVPQSNADGDDDGGPDGGDDDIEAAIDLTTCPSFIAGDHQSRGEVASWLKNAYGVSFPVDFFHLWEFCAQRDPACPTDALRSVLGVRLVGPYDFLAGSFADESILSVKSVHLHWRYYYDPPEFLTLLAADAPSKQHWGYFRDDPSEDPAFVAVGGSRNDSVLQPVASNALATLISIMDSRSSSREDKAAPASLKTLRGEVEQFAAQNGCVLSTRNVDRARSRKVNAHPLNRIGIVVPYDKEQDVGYRPLPMSNGRLKTLLDDVVNSSSQEQRDKYGDKLQEIVTFVQFANDECDYGMGLELSMDLFAHGSRAFHTTLIHLMPTVYELLGRDVFAKIIRLHLRNRAKTVGS